MDFTSIPAVIQPNGWATTPPVVDSRSIDDITARLHPALEGSASRGGVRNLLTTSDVVREMAAVGPLRDAATAVLGRDSGAVRAILFDKTPQANWKVVVHQDLTIAVAEQRPVQGYGPWSTKDGVHHVQPPVEVLEHMVAVRLHLDACHGDNGPVRVLSGSHGAGRLSVEDIQQWRDNVAETVCIADRGGLLLFRPLLLHASSPANVPGHRRVLHIEFGPSLLPGGMSWHTWVSAHQSRAA